MLFMSFQLNTTKVSLFDTYAFIGLGANLPGASDPRQTLLHTIDCLQELSEEPLLISSLIETSPVDCPPDSPDFINAVVGLVPMKNETPVTLLRQLQTLEHKLGRRRSGKVNEARVIDLDLLSFKNERSNTTELILPHPRATQRVFVLQPLYELLGDEIFPGSNTRLSSLLSMLE